MITNFPCWVDVDIVRFQKYKKIRENQSWQKIKSWGTNVIMAKPHFSYKY